MTDRDINIKHIKKALIRSLYLLDNLNECELEIDKKLDIARIEGSIDFIKEALKDLK